MATETFDVFSSCLQLLNITDGEIESFITSGKPPDSVTKQTSVSYALVLVLETVIRQSTELTIVRDLPRLLQEIDQHVILPKKITNLLSKIDKKSKKCQTCDDVMNQLIVSISNPSPEFVGVTCNEVGITKTILEGNQMGKKFKLTEMIIAELELYRRLKRNSWADLLQWVLSIQEDEVKDVSMDKFRNMVEECVKKKRHGSRNKLTDVTNEMKVTQFILPQVQSHKPPRSLPNCKKCKLLNLKNTHLQKQLLKTRRELKRSRMECVKLLSENGKLTEKSKEVNFREFQLHKQSLKLKREEENALIAISNFKARNMKRKLQRREEKISVLENKKAKMENKCRETVRKKKNIAESKRYHVKKKAAKVQETKLATKFMNLQNRYDEIEERYDEIERNLNEIQEEKRENKPSLKRRNQYNPKVRECYMGLASLGVSTRKMSAVTALVLSTIGGFPITEKDLPKQTFNKYMPREANLVASQFVASELGTHQNTTLHTDGTSRDGDKVVDFEFTVEKGKTLTAGIIPVASGESNQQMEAFKFLINKLSDLEGNITTTDASKKLIRNIKNTMGDQAASQKSFNRQLEQYRAEIVPDVITNWDNFDEATQQQMTKMNHFYCNLHVLIGCAMYCDEALALEEELWREEYGRQLGAETLKENQYKDGNYIKRGDAKSATQRNIYSACSLLSPGGNQQSGKMKEFATFRRLQGIEHMELHPFRANRFNVLFELGAGLYYHKDHIIEALCDGWIPPQNKHVRAVAADMKCLPLLAGARALGILYKQFTDPYWRLLEHPELHIIKLSSHLKHVYGLLDKWSKDPSQLLDKDMPPIFTLPSGSSIQQKVDHVFEALYHEATEDMNRWTKGALKTMCTSIKVVLDRRCADHMVGKYSGNVDVTIMDETMSVPMSNQRGENDFGVWAYMKQIKPSLSAMSLEGNAMFLLDHVGHRLALLRKNNPTQYTNIISMARQKRREYEKKYAHWEEKNRKYAEERMKTEKRRHKKSERKKQERQQEWRVTVEKYGECKSKRDVKNFKSKFTTKLEQSKHLKHQIMYAKLIYATKLKAMPSYKQVTKVSKKSIDQMAQDLTKIVQFVHGIESQSENESDEDLTRWSDDETDEGESSELDKEESSESDVERSSESDEEDESEVEMQDEMDNYVYEFKSGDIIAVAYEDNWHIGCVDTIFDSESARVTFMERYHNHQNRFCWSEKKDYRLQIVHKKFVIADNIDIAPDSSLRFNYLDSSVLKKISTRYHQYHQKWFSV